MTERERGNDGKGDAGMTKGDVGMVVQGCWELHDCG